MAETTLLKAEERKDTGRIYLMNVDHAIHTGAFIEIRRSN